MSKRVIFLRGLPGSGKTTWALDYLANHPGAKRVNKDELRAMLDAGKYSKGNEKFILAVRDALILQALAEGYHVIVDDTNFRPQHEQRIRELVKGLAVVEIKDFSDVPLETCLERNRKRPNPVPESTIRQMYRQYVRPTPAPPPFDPVLPTALICDIDGTLALICDRSPYDAARCEEDTLNEPVNAILRAFAQDQRHILLVSGRSELYRPQTEAWLNAHSVRYESLFMRPEGDMRRDAIVKRELYEQYIKGRYNVTFVLDDRTQMVAMWRYELGLTCLQVAEGDF